MFRFAHSLLIFSLASLILFATNQHAYANEEIVEADTQYCFRDSDDAIYDALKDGNDFPAEEEDASFVLQQVISCNQSANLTDQAIGISEKVEIVGLSCNPSVSQSCVNKNIDYTNFEVQFTFDGEGADSDTPYTLTIDDNNNSVHVTNLLVAKLFKNGTRACLYFNGDFSIGNNNLGEQLVNAKSHCVFLPPPQITYSAPQWGDIIADVCLDYRAGHSKYTWFPVSGVVVECVEDTMRNIFSLQADGTDIGATTAPLFAMNDPNNYNRTFFSTVQENLRGFVLAALVLYVTIFGLSVVMSQSIPSKGDFIMAVIKFAMVLYFTLGTGIVDFVPRLIDMSKTLSQILMDTSKNLPIEYGYCDFSPQSLGAENQYPPGYETMELWDTIDCKMSKYLGMREGRRSYDVGGGETITDLTDSKLRSDSHPKMLYITLMIWGGNGAGFICFLFGLPCIIFMITLLIRIIHVYIIAMMAIYFLAFLAPLIIPAALFQYTKDIFDNWLKQLISFSLQPVILFAFLALVFAISDFVMYRGNTEFCKETDSIMMKFQQQSDTGECDLAVTTQDELNQNWQCAGDNAAPACILLKHTNFTKGPLGATTWSTIEGTKPREVIKAFMMLFFIFFVLNSILPTIEELSHRLTDSSGGGATAIATGTQGITAKYGPSRAMTKGTSTAASGVGAAAGFMRGGKKGK